MCHNDHWKDISTAPKDGQAILLLSAAYTDTRLPDAPYHHPASVAIGSWCTEGTSWVDEDGRMGGNCYTLGKTGTWQSGHGWFQPNEVTHWQSLPLPPHHDMTTPLPRRQVSDNWADPEYRHTYAEGFLMSRIAMQLKVLREERGWTQQKLAERTGMKQSVISTLEDVNYWRWSIRTLLRLAKAFDLWLHVSFESYESFAAERDGMSRSSLQRPPANVEDLCYDEEEIGSETTSEG